MDDVTAIFVILGVAWIMKPILKGVFGWHSKSDYRRDR